ALACFALAAAALLRFYVSEQLARAPVDVYSTSQMVAQNASYFDVSTGSPVSGATLTLTATIRGNVNASDGEVAVWDTATVMEDLPNRKRIEIGEFRLAFDRKDAALVNCCGSVARPAPGAPEMYGGAFFPFGMERRAYNVYDSQTNRAWPMQFEGTDTVDGMEVYRYVQRVDPTNTGPAPAEVPSTL
ncbi:porin PorA family protein, partial [Actinomadura adrarensis]